MTEYLTQTRILCLAIVTTLTIQPIAGQEPAALAEALRARIARDTAELSAAPVAELARLTIIRGSNLAANPPIALLDPRAYERGLDDSTAATARAMLLLAVAEGRSSGRASSDSMVQMLLAVDHGAPARRRHHPFPPGRVPFALVILTRGLADRVRAARLSADLAVFAYHGAARWTKPHETAETRSTGRGYFSLMRAASAAATRASESRSAWA